jgi:hypothetical protein
MDQKRHPCDVLIGDPASKKRWNLDQKTSKMTFTSKFKVNDINILTFEAISPQL